MTKKKREARIEGEVAYIPLTKGYETVVDVQDLPLVGQHNWCVREGRNTCYAFRGEGGKGNQTFFRMHRELVGPIPEGHVVDHIDGNGLNNRRKNLRVVSVEQNARNSSLSKRNTSGYKGVYFQKALGKWGAKICRKGKQNFLGYFGTPEEAYTAYCKASEELHGEFGRVK